ncbi:cobalt-precorrin 5A hydrolase [Intestinibacillus massiliensis]|nr:cobalt-precorrin 5A hydrolase [Intestinibacillus massiliensis]
MTHLKIVSFTPGGDALSLRLRKTLPGMLLQRYARSTDPSLRHTELRRFTQQAMFDCDGLVFIGAAGIAVRSVAPFLRGKAEDPAVVVVDEQGKYVIPLLSGHLGGANALAVQIAAAMHATPVLTTATDVNGLFAVDTWAKAHGFEVCETDLIRYVSSALLRGETVGLRSDFPVCTPLPQGVALQAEGGAGIVLSVRNGDEPFTHTLHLVPRAVWAGIGCRKGVASGTLEQVLLEVLEREHVPLSALCGLATIDIKAEEPGLRALAAKYRLPIRVFSAGELQSAEGTFTPSAFVRQTVGVDNVCERAAVCASEGTLLCSKAAANGVTVALAAEKREVHFS